jgi:hypothetical protein
MKHDCTVGWSLVIGSIFLLTVRGNLDLLIFLIPLSLLLGCALLWLRGSKNRTDERHQKRVA